MVVDGRIDCDVAKVEQCPMTVDAHTQAIKSDGGSTSYYELPVGATELNDLIEHKKMSFALGNIFKACYRYGEKDAASRLYDLNKIIYFAERLKTIEKAVN